ncbi:MAG TPA: sugar transferase [Isosphaeraceae bacterium]|nr:sugar transferase [Isosphaeraceae bacterium]
MANPLSDALTAAMLTEHPRDAQIEGTERLRRLVEFLAAVVLFVLVSPFVLICLFLVRVTSPGPVIYTQKRLGHRGRHFTLYKIRTMCVQSEPDGPKWCRPRDPRVTPVGRILRWSHLDELPQLINILRGEMSIIGPRPERPEIAVELERALPDHRCRLAVRPGVTGLAQVLQRPDQNLKMVCTKLFYDLRYIDQRSWWLDLRILLATVLHLLNIPPVVIARVFAFPFLPVEPTAQTPAAVEADLVTAAVAPQLGDA